MTASALKHVSVVSGRAKVNTYTARDGSTKDVELAYDVFGTSGRPLVLIMGIGAQGIFWDATMCEQFVAAGFHVVRFDHRDIGHSTHLDAPVPRPGRMIARSMLKLSVDAPYSLSDMAADVIGLCDHLKIDRAHFVGASMGGMITQHIGIEHNARVASLTTIMTGPGGRRYLPKPHALRALFAPRPKDAEQAGQHVEKLFATIGSKGVYANSAERLRLLGAEAYSRGMNPRGFLRHFGAVAKSGDRRPLLPSVQAPLLVIHGTHDPMFSMGAARKLAALVPDSTWLPLTGMGHDLPQQLWPTIVHAIARHAERADSR